MDGFGENTVGGFPQAPVVRLRSTAKATPIGVGIRAVGHPRHWVRLRPSGSGALGCFHSIPLPGPWIGNTGEGGPPPARETGWPGPPRHEKNGP